MTRLIPNTISAEDSETPHAPRNPHSDLKREEPINSVKILAPSNCISISRKRGRSRAEPYGSGGVRLDSGAVGIRKL